MKVLIDIPEENYKLICSDGRPFLPSYKWIKNGTPIPDNATNGDILKTIFSDDDTLKVIEIRMKGDWWNASYQKGGK